MCEFTDQFKKNDYEWILSKVLRSIERLYEKDFWLLEKNLNERSITHKLAEHLQPLFSDYNVDCEYNGDETRKEYGRKVIYLIKNYRGESTDDVDVDYESEEVIKNVIPDIIIHSRGVNDYNLCAIEVKKSTNRNGDAIDYDFAKLKAYTDVCHGNLKYRIGVFICFTTKSTEKKCSLKVFIGGDERSSYYRELDFSHVISK